MQRSNGLATTLKHIDITRSGPGAVPLTHNGTRFTVWAPSPESIELHVISPEQRIIPLNRDENGMCTVDVEGLSTGTRYFFRVEGKDRPDPASRYQPEGVHGASEVVTVT